MSIETQIYLNCDATDCQESFTGEPETDLVSVRKEASKADAWVFRDNEDYCPEHDPSIIEELQKEVANLARDMGRPCNDEGSKWYRHAIKEAVEERHAFSKGVGLILYLRLLYQFTNGLNPEARKLENECMRLITAVAKEIGWNYREYDWRVIEGEDEQQDKEDNRQGSEEVRSSKVS